MAVRVARRHIDKAFTVALCINAIVAIFSTFVFFLSTWWIFLLLGTLGLPLVIAAVLLYKFTTLRDPMKRSAKRFVGMVYERTIMGNTALLRKIYEIVCWFIPRDEWKHINWGYAALTPNGETLENLERPDREKIFYNQLYYYLVNGLGNWATLEGKTVIEVRCGGGAGLSFLTRHLNPNKAIGVDDSAINIDDCKHAFGENPKMHFIHMDSLTTMKKAGELSDEMIDLAISVQSSEHVSDFSKFVEGVQEILSFKGLFVFADLRSKEDWRQIEKDLESSSLKILKNEDITNNVMQALKLEEVKKWQSFSDHFGPYLKMFLKKLRIAKENPIVQEIEKGSVQAKAYMLYKVPPRQIQLD